MSASPSVLVRCVDVKKSFGEGALATPVLHGISLELRSRELCLLMGPSGSGKTTLLSILAGLMRPTSGTIELCGIPISDLPQQAATRVRRDHLGFVFQTYNLFPALTALDNVAEILRMKGMAKGEALERSRNALNLVGLEHRLGHRPDQLSGGQKQRVAIARAIAGEPALVLGDEITAALDSTSGLAVMELLRGVVAAGRGVLVVTHDHRLERFAERVLEIEDGLIVRDRAGALPPRAEVA